MKYIRFGSVLGLALMLGFGSFASKTYAISQNQVDAICVIINCSDETRAALEVLIGGKKDKEEKSEKSDKVLICHKASKKHKGRTISVSERAQKAHLKHGDTVGACDGSGNGNGTSTPSTSLSITNVSATSTGSTSAEVMWKTNKNSNSVVWYSTENPLDMNDNDTASTTESGLVKVHSVDLTGLTASTTYYFIVGSTQGTSTATSSQGSFTTEQ